MQLFLLLVLIVLMLVVKAVSYTHLDVYKRQEVAKKGYEGLLTQFIEVDNKGVVSITKGCAVAGLGGKPCLLYTSRCV